ncbi:sensor histidine kinase [Thermophagus xiamenensis]|uniref:histidine kinase n=1 Tax=Thermophagus xiamenensis TaxID=385682 RepID=A0A1I2B0X0_9BACT|nr:PAS domain-containing sensor histidine kinase [Thermophagus xiamenensis]SFE49657.1 PAS domain S-box-containing protein [Thermophagus xiamenensis]
MISEQQLGKALEHFGGIIMITDASGRILFVNERFENVYGYEKSEVIGEKPSILKSGFHSRQFYEELWQTISSGDNWRGEMLNRCKNGEIITEQATISPIYSEGKKEITGYIAIKFNVTEKEKIKKRLEWKEQLFEKLFENSPLGIFILEEISTEAGIVDYMITRANLTASVIFNRISFINQRLSSVLENQNLSALIQAHKSVRHGDEIYEWEDVCKGKYLEFKLFAIEKHTKCLLISDISKKVRMELKLKENENRLKELNETKDKIFRIISHDLRNPFQTIIGFSHLLNQGIENYPPETLKEIAAQVCEISEKNYQLIDDLLNWSKSQLGQLSAVTVNVPLKEVTDKVVSYLKPQADKKDIQLINDISDNVVVRADKDMTEFIIRNLVHNGIKFTREGGSVYCFSEKDDQHIKIHIKDTGIGIHPDKVSKIFSLTGNLSTKGTSEEAGTGLGLMLSYEMVVLNHGKIEVASEPGKGSCFTVILPAAS